MTNFTTNSEPSLPKGVDEDVTRPPMDPPEEIESIVDVERALPVDSHEKEGRRVIARDEGNEQGIELLDCTYPNSLTSDTSSDGSETSRGQKKTSEETLPRESNATAVTAAVPAALAHKGTENSENASIPSLQQSRASESTTRSKKKRPDPIDTDMFDDEYTSQRQMQSVQKSKKKTSRAAPTTPETVVSTPPASPSNNPTTILLEHRTKRESRSGLSFLLAHRKKIMCLLGLWALVATGAGTYLLTDWLKIPGLDAQVQELTRQVDRLEEQVDALTLENDRLETNVQNLTVQVDELEFQVDRLESEVVRMGGEVDRLQNNVGDLDGVVSKLETTNGGLETNVANLEDANAGFKELNSDLTASNLLYEQLNLQLSSANAAYKASNENLNSTVTELKGELRLMDLIEQNLTKTVNEYENRNQELSVEVDKLSAIKTDLDGKVEDLGVQIDFLEEQNANYSALNRDLGTIVSFLNNTGDQFEQTYEALTSTLATQILVRRNLMVEDTHLKYSNTVLHWNCDMDSHFRLRDFVRDDLVPLGSEAYDDIIVYLEDELLGKVCINTQDLESFFLSNVLQQGEPLESMSLADVKAGVSAYTTLVFNYYFPDEGEQGGLSEEDWSEADYECHNLPEDKQFSFSNR